MEREEDWNRFAKSGSVDDYLRFTNEFREEDADANAAGSYETSAGNTFREEVQENSYGQGDVTDCSSAYEADAEEFETVDCSSAYETDAEEFETVDSSQYETDEDEFEMSDCSNEYGTDEEDFETVDCSDSADYESEDAADCGRNPYQE